MNSQEMFDAVARHLLSQRTHARAMIRVNGGLAYACAYRGFFGSKCAIGVLIPDDKYDRKMEGHIVSKIRSVWPELSDYIPDEVLATELQMLHDKFPVLMWPHRLQRLADEFGLDCSVIGEFKWATEALARQERATKDAAAVFEKIELPTQIELDDFSSWMKDQEVIVRAMQGPLIPKELMTVP